MKNVICENDGLYLKLRSGTITACPADFRTTAFTSKRNFWATRVKDTRATCTFQYQDTERTYRTVRHFGLNLHAPRIHHNTKGYRENVSYGSSLYVASATKHVLV